MSNNINTERVPLLEAREYLQNLQNPVNCKELCWRLCKRCCRLCKEQFWVLFAITMILLLIIPIIVFAISPYAKFPKLPTDVSRIPYEYRFRCKSHWKCNYIIEGYPTEFNSESNSFSSIKDDNQPKFIKYAEIIVPYLKYGNFNVIEFRHYPNGTVFPVSTVNSRIRIYSTNEIEIVFAAPDDADLELLESCKYRISWTWWFNGYIWKQCNNANETIFKQIAFFKGNPSWGLTLSSIDGGINYGYSTMSSFFWDLYARNIFINQTAPFPPIIPALYIAHYYHLSYRQNRDLTDY
ncbi:14557_t:CDS:2 [Cetraspora pellucida]|uniref:14557_t:CDS:1 n=1 Tax=Cetraspora pellucida TaxID=1433469 RepID=A0A9N9FUI3_9GLOM|nr:14557_t:CDS:2 [Cetraspora pellucida]